MIKAFADFVVTRIFGLDLESRLGDSLNFFIYDSLKIIFLLSFMVFAISYIRSYFPPERVKKILERLRGIWAHLLASLLGVVSPFCSCSTVPIFIGFVESGIPLGVTFSFLITSPIVNEIALGFLFITFGAKIAVLYTAAGVLIGVAGGIIIQKLGVEHLVEEYVYQMEVGEAHMERISFRDRIRFAKESTASIVRRVWPFIVVGIGIGSLIHGYAPSQLLVRYAGPRNPLAVFVAVLIGIPLYSNAVGTIPIAEALIKKGVGVGTALSFMMSVVALSLPEMILLRRVIKTGLIALFVGITGVSIILVGYLFNLVL